MGAVPAEKASETSLDWNTNCAKVLPHDYYRYGNSFSRVDDTCCRISYYQTVRFSSTIILKLNITVICGYQDRGYSLQILHRFPNKLYYSGIGLYQTLLPDYFDGGNVISCKIAISDN